jgi:hypothetical protein
MKHLFIILLFPLCLMSCSSEKDTKPTTSAKLTKPEVVSSSAKKVASRKHKHHVQQAQINNSMTNDVIIVASQTPHRFEPNFGPAVSDQTMTHEIIVAATQPAPTNVHGHPSVEGNVHGHDNQSRVEVAANGSDVVIYEND